MKRNYKAEIVKRASARGNFSQVSSGGKALNAYKHKTSGEIINLENGTWKVDRKDGSKGSLGNGVDMYRYEDLDKAMNDVDARAQESACPTCKGKKVLENHKAVYDCPDCGGKTAVPINGAKFNPGPDEPESIQ